MSTGSDDVDADQTSFVELVQELERLNGNLNGLFAKVGRLEERVEELEEIVDAAERLADVERVDQELEELRAAGMDRHEWNNER